jgi:hypothetical protein
MVNYRPLDPWFVLFIILSSINMQLFEITGEINTEDQKESIGSLPIRYPDEDHLGTPPLLALNRFETTSAFNFPLFPFA